MELTRITSFDYIHGRFRCVWYMQQDLETVSINALLFTNAIKQLLLSA
jgi:hypothetical protein